MIRRQHNASTDVKRRRRGPSRVRGVVAAVLALAAFTCGGVALGAGATPHATQATALAPSRGAGHAVKSRQPAQGRLRSTGSSTPCVESRSRQSIAPVCAQAVATAKAHWRAAHGGAPDNATTERLGGPQLPPPVVGNELAIKTLGVGFEIARMFASYYNGESGIFCTAASVRTPEIYGACAELTYHDAETGEKAPSTNSATDVELDACGKVVGGSLTSGWFTGGSPTGELEKGAGGGWVGGLDQQVPSSAHACEGMWTVQYEFCETFHNLEQLCRAASNTFKVTLTPGTSPEELYGQRYPGMPYYVQACEGDPVNCATGNESVSQTDLTVGGRGIPLTFTRTYNAQAAVTQPTHGSAGFGWSTTFGDHLAISTSEGTTTVKVVEAGGSATAYTGNGTPGALTGPVWNQSKLILNSDGSYSYTLPNQTIDHFDSSGRLLTETDRNGNATTMHRNAEGRLETVSDASGRELTLAYNAEGEIETVTDPAGHKAKYTYEGGNLATVTLPGEASPRWKFKYDEAHRLTKLTDGRGGATTNEYDASNRVVSQIDPLERTTKFEYLTSETKTPETKITNQATGAVTKEVFDPGYEPEKITHGVGTASATTETLAYNAAGSPTSVRDGNEHLTKYGYDAEGNRTSMLDPTEHETKWGYNSTHDVTSATTPKGETTTFKRDAHGNVEVVERPAPAAKTQVTKYKYASNGNLESVTDPVERTTKFEYDSHGARTVAIDPAGDKRTFADDADSQETARVSPKGNVEGGEPAKYTTKTERDEQERPLKVTDPLGHETKYTYDGDGNLETSTDALGHKTKYTYDADNEPTKTELPNTTVLETTYDGARQVTSQIDGAKHVTKYTRNVLEQVTEVEDPLKHKTTQEYDKAGNLVLVTDPLARKTKYVYDAANRVKEITYSDGITHSVVNEYDADGERTKMVDGSGTTTLTYDQLDRLTEGKDGHGNIVKYEYDLANEPTKVTYPNGKAVTRTYDKASRLEKVTDWAEHTTTFGYDPNSNQTLTTWPSGTSSEDKQTFNEADQLTEVKMVKGAETLASLAYTRDVVGQLKGATSKGLPGEEKPAYEYDANNRLTKGAALSYEYDAADNPTKTGSTTNTFNAANEIEKAGTTAYTFDTMDQRTKMSPPTGAATTYTYDEAGNLTAVEKPKEGKIAGLTDIYTYDGSGLRISQTIAGTKTFLAWQTGRGLPLLLNDGANSYIYGPGDLPIEQISTAGTVLYVHHDQQGSTRLLTSTAGKSEATFTYDPYGNTTGTTGTAVAGLGFDGETTASDTGLIYLRARVYDPKTAQFMNSDSVNELSHERFVYAYDNPVNWHDPTGLLSVGDIIQGVGVGLVCAATDGAGCVAAGLLDADANVVKNDYEAIIHPCKAIELERKSLEQAIGLGVTTGIGKLATGTLTEAGRRALEATPAGRAALHQLIALGSVSATLAQFAYMERNAGAEQDCPC
jgi:RHS repeat-associated protein